ncbi:uncharacterized protein C2845_PM04G29120 [Panicum miliaceum]|uniref:Ribosomal protein L7Ae/L30e/S12e/Gadd45 domain-containing protein n=1 Tax=Panicum miliaceum TaxID=4540 RepID=A0A3L6QPJ6_PANMI|nr:uncharacterized protein C2845_PM04G29120 [Panicum miliaceum]
MDDGGRESMDRNCNTRGSLAGFPTNGKLTSTPRSPPPAPDLRRLPTLADFRRPNTSGGDFDADGPCDGSRGLHQATGILNPAAGGFYSVALAFRSSGYWAIGSRCLVPMSKKRKSLKPAKSLRDAEEVQTSDYIAGDVLDDLLSKLVRSVEVAKASRGGLPEKIWMKKQFAIGVNDVTRVLERMPPAAAINFIHSSTEAQTVSGRRRAPLVPLQAVLIAADCNPKWLTKHIPTLASTRQVPVLCIKDNKGGSVRLGLVVNIRTALAIGVKAGDSIVNKTIDEVLECSKQ